jgi:dynein heavy chain
MLFKVMKSLFLLQQSVFPDPGTVYDYYFVKQASGSWGKWMDYVDKKKLEIPKDAKVHVDHGSL